MNLIPIKCCIKVFPEDRKRLSKKKKPFEEQTIVGNVSRDFTYYQNWFVQKKIGIELEPPPFGGHVTIHNGIENINNKVITVYYDPDVYIHWRFLAVKVYSKDLNAIRKKLGLSRKEFFHITIGKIKDGDISEEIETSYEMKRKHVNVSLSI
jgi:hypothetical protein